MVTGSASDGVVTRPRESAQEPLRKFDVLRVAHALRNREPTARLMRADRVLEVDVVSWANAHRVQLTELTKAGPLRSTAADLLKDLGRTQRTARPPAPY